MGLGYIKDTMIPGYFVYMIIAELPVLITTGIVFFVIISILTPNPKKHRLFLGWLIAETIEHFSIILFMFFSVAFGPLFYITFLFFILYVYGRFIGDAKTEKDYLKLLLMYFIFLILFSVPELTVYIDYKYGIHGYISLTVISVISIIVYLVNKKKKKKKIGKFTRDGIFEVRDQLL